MLENTLENPLDSKEIKSVNPERNHPWIFIGRTDAEAEAPIIWPPDVKSWLLGKDSDAGKDWGQEGDDRGWDGWMTSPVQWTCIWANSGRYWKRGKSGRLQPMRLQRVGPDSDSATTQTDIYIQMFITLVIIAKMWEQFKCPSRDAW